MSEMTTLNVEKPDAARFTQLQLNRQAREGRRISQPEYISYVLSVLEHLEDCAFCQGNIHRHVKVAKKKE